MSQWERATDKQRNLIRLLENELDPPVRLSSTTLAWMSKREASDLIIRMNKYKALLQKDKQIALL